MAPIEKRSVQEERKKKPIHINYDELKSALIKRITSINDIPIVYLTPEYGEAELCMFLNRDIYLNSVFYTKDSDIFTIAYQHVPICSTDLVWVCMDQLIESGQKERELNFYDMTKFYYIHLPKPVFLFVIGNCGTDFTRSFYTATMIDALLQFENCCTLTFIEKITQLATERNFKDLELIFDNLFVEFKMVNKRMMYSRKELDRVDNLAKIEWYTRYIFGGTPKS